MIEFFFNMSHAEMYTAVLGAEMEIEDNVFNQAVFVLLLGLIVYSFAMVLDLFLFDHRREH